MDAAQKHLIVGLGNPGGQYGKTRHNLGFMVAERLAGRWGQVLSKKKFEAVYTSGVFTGKPFILALPQTYMNLSGKAVSRLKGFFGIEKEGLIVMHDDLDLPFGLIKIKEKGGSGGHKGLKSIMEAIGGGDFIRLRLGIGHPEGEREVTDFVLSRFNKSEQKVLDSFLDTAADAVETILVSGVRKGMNQFNNQQIPV